MAEEMGLTVTGIEGTFEYVNRGYAGRQMLGGFPNGYGISVIQGPYSYGGTAGLYELAVRHPEHLCYASPVTSDVRGRLTEAEVIALIHEVAALPANPDCDHERPDDWLDRDDVVDPFEAIGSFIGMMSDPGRF